MGIYSCDTMVALGNSTRSGHVIFAKNSDRPVTESQPLITFAAADHAPRRTALLYLYPDPSGSTHIPGHGFKALLDLGL